MPASPSGSPVTPASRYLEADAGQEDVSGPNRDAGQHAAREQMQGFALATRTVLDGGVGRMLDMTGSNLRNIRVHGCLTRGTERTTQ
jgi:hypothetical protein